MKSQHTATFRYQFRDVQIITGSTQWRNSFSQQPGVQPERRLSESRFHAVFMKTRTDQFFTKFIQMDQIKIIIRQVSFLSALCKIIKFQPKHHARATNLILRANLPHKQSHFFNNTNSIIVYFTDTFFSPDSRTFFTTVVPLLSKIIRLAKLDYLFKSTGLH